MTTKTRVKCEDLLKALTAVESGLSTKGTVEQSTCCVLNKGRMWTFNDEVACSCKLPAGMKEFEAAVPHAEFKSLLSKMGDGEVEVDLDGEGQLTISAKRRRAGIRVQSEIALPIASVPVPKSRDEWSEIPKGFRKAVETVRQCASGDSSVMVMCCIHVCPGWMEACDNLQAIRCKIDTGVEEKILLKRDDLAGAASEGVKAWTVGPAWVHFRDSAGTVTSCRRLDAEYPSLEDILKIDGSRSNFSKEVVKAVDVAKVFVDEKRDAMGLTIDLKKGALRMRAESEAGWYEEKQRVDYDGDPLRFRIAPRLLQEACKRSNSVTIGENKLGVKGDGFVYVSCLELED